VGINDTNVWLKAIYCVKEAWMQIEPENFISLHIKNVYNAFKTKAENFTEPHLQWLTSPYEWRNSQTGAFVSQNYLMTS
jgi:hypothetical protein